MAQQNSFLREQVGGVDIDGYSSSASITSLPVFLANLSMASIHVSYPATGSPVGSFKVQVSDYLEKGGSGTILNLNNTTGYNPIYDFDTWTWIDVIDSATSTAGVDAIGFDYAFIPNRWIRMVYTRSSGSILLTARCQIKGSLA